MYMFYGLYILKKKSKRIPTRDVTNPLQYTSTYLLLLFVHSLEKRELHTVMTFRIYVESTFTRYCFDKTKITDIQVK